MENTTIEGLGFAHFLGQTDSMGKIVLGILLVLSVASWYLILTRALANTLAQRRADVAVGGGLGGQRLVQPRRC